MSEALQQRLEFAAAERDRILPAVASKAERRKGWYSVAFVFLKKWARDKKRSDRFTAEEITLAYAADPNFVQPEDLRWWGPVYTLAINRSVLAITGAGAQRAFGHRTKGGNIYRSLVSGMPWTQLEAK